MSTDLDLNDLETLTESAVLECKAAGGQSGRGALPASIWESYAAMANTDGGVILLGVAQNGPFRFRVSGIAEPERLVKEFWDQLHNRQKVSVNLLAEDDVAVIELSGQHVVRIRVPRAPRTLQPVHIGVNPLTGTYRRRFEGDYRCDEDTVRRMLAEQRDTPRDATVLPRHTLADLETETLRAYRQVFQNRQPDHPWVTLSDQDFLARVGGWARDRESGAEGLTVAGLLMFGQLRPILDAVPNYIVDFQEQAGHGETRWTDRVTTDGAWSGNLYDFFRRVMPRLTRDLKVPFRLQTDTRVDDTPVHQALREAFVNALIHADYGGRVSVLVIKRPDEFEFRNPGTMRVPIKEAFPGGVSDCRNRTLQKLFQLIGLGEQAGSGLPKIFRQWSEQHWRHPHLREHFGPQDRTTLTLSTENLLPAPVMADLDRRFGGRFRTLHEVQRTILATAAIEGLVTHRRMREIAMIHPSDLSKYLADLVAKGFLTSQGSGRGTTYELLHEPLVKPPFKGFEPPLKGFELPDKGLLGSTDESDVFPDNTAEKQVEALIDLLPHLSPSKADALRELRFLPLGSEAWLAALDAAQLVAGSRRSTSEKVEQAILTICCRHFVTPRHFALLLNRKSDFLSLRYLRPMAQSGRLEMLYPHNLTHPEQAYRVRQATSDAP